MVISVYRVGYNANRQHARIGLLRSLNNARKLLRNEENAYAVVDGVIVCRSQYIEGESPSQDISPQRKLFAIRPEHSLRYSLFVWQWGRWQQVLVDGISFGLLRRPEALEYIRSQGGILTAEGSNVGY